MTTKTLQKYKTKYFADSVEWCPISDNENFGVVGNYQLVEGANETETQADDDRSQNSRVGQLYLFQLDPESTEEPLRIGEEIDHCGILDIKWYRSTLNGHPTFGVVDAEGHICMFQMMEEEEGSKKLKQIFHEDLGSNVLGLSLDWSAPTGGSDVSSSALLVASGSDGKLSTWQLSDSGLENLAHWKAHDFEAWISAFDYSDPNIVYSGGDDCRFKGWDLRSPPSRPTFISKIHTMGVCSIQSNINNDHFLATGSYDEQLMLWDNRNMKSPLKEIGLGGGIWRIKWEPHAGRYILTASMHNGFHIVDTGAQLADSDLEIVAHYEEHESLAYGVDWYHGPSLPAAYCHGNGEEQDVRTIISCSFYDSSVQLWVWEREKHEQIE